MANALICEYSIFSRCQEGVLRSWADNTADGKDDTPHPPVKRQALRRLSGRGHETTTVASDR